MTDFLLWNIKDVGFQRLKASLTINPHHIEKYAMEVNSDRGRQSPTSNLPSLLCSMEERHTGELSIQLH